MKVDSTTTAATTTSATPGALTGSKDEFLKLFMAQLQHQDPMDPKTGADMVAQLAQFSSVEQAQQTNQHLVDLASAQAATSNASLANLVGRDCSASAGAFQLDKGGAVPPLQVDSTTALTGASAVITNADGVELRRIPIPDGGTSADVTWDGRSTSGSVIPPGTYQISIDPGKTTGTISQQWHGRVDAVELATDGTKLRMGGVLLSPSDVRTIGGASASPVTPTAAALASLAKTFAPLFRNDSQVTEPAMSITNSLYIGISGLQAHGDAISIVGDNIANASTVGYKRNRASFEDMLGGEINGQRLGGGSIQTGPQTMWQQGTITRTDNPLDLAISGGGLFMVKGSHGGQQGQYFTRDGRFHLDNQGYVTNQQGLRLQGFGVDGTGTRSLTPGDLPLGARQSAPIATTKASMQLSLDSTSVVGPAFDAANPSATSNYATSATVYDSLGTSHHVDVYFRAQGAGAWEYHAMVDGSELNGGTAGVPQEIANGTLQFNTNGTLQAQTLATSTADFVNATPGQTIALNFGDDIASGGTGRNGTTQYNGSSAVNGLDVDGRSAGKLNEITISDDGKISGIFDNGDQFVLAQVALADFANDEGLRRVGDGLVQATPSSGQALVDVVGAGARGSVVSGSLEASNVDIGNELVTLIAYQRAFEANAKTVTTADEMMSEVNNLKR